MARQITILERFPTDPLSFRVAYWLDVPAGLQARYADPTATSAIDTLVAGELDLLRAGAVVEVVETATVHAARTMAQMRADLIARRAILQAEMNGSKRWERYGTFFDGQSWSLQGTG